MRDTALAAGSLARGGWSPLPPSRPTELEIGLETASGDARTAASTPNLDTQGSIPSPSPFPRSLMGSNHISS